MSILMETSSFESFIQLLGVMLIFVFVLAAVYFVTRWMGGIQKGRTKNNNLQIVDTISVGNNKLISIVQAGKKYLVVSIGKEEVHMLAELEEEDLKDLSFLEQPVSGKSQESFKEILERMKAPKK